MGKNNKRRSSSTAIDLSFSKRARNDAESVEHDSEHVSAESDYIPEHRAVTNDNRDVDQSDAESEEIAETKRKKRENWDRLQLVRELQVEAIIAHKTNNGKRGTMHYLIKWKDESKGNTWLNIRKTCSLCPNILQEYKKKAWPKEIVSHKVDSRSNVLYRVKWNDESKDDTWEKRVNAERYWKEIVRQYNNKVEKEIQDQVEAIVKHEIQDRISRFLIKWKDRSKDETWETAYRTKGLCPKLFTEFRKKNPDIHVKTKHSLAGKKRRIKATKTDVITDKEWEVSEIVGIKMKEDNSREFLIRWKGYGAESDSWEGEENLDCPELIKKFVTQAEKPKKLAAKNATTLPAKKKIAKKSDRSGSLSSKPNTSGSSRRVKRR